MKLVFAVDAACIGGLACALRSLQALRVRPPVVVLALIRGPGDAAAFAGLARGSDFDPPVVRPVETVVKDPAALALMKRVPYFLKYAALTPATADRVLFCDHDVAFMGEIAPLLQTGLDGCALAAVPDQGFSLKGTTERHNRRIGGTAAAPYFNSGVLLCDTRKLAAAGILKTAMDLYRADLARFPFPDQCALNLALQQDNREQGREGSLLKILPDKWNWQTPAMRLRPDLLQPVHHFTGTKPWQISGWHHHPACKEFYGWPPRAFSLSGIEVGAKKRLSETVKRLVFRYSPVMKKRRRVFSARL